MKFFFTALCLLIFFIIATPDFADTMCNDSSEAPGILYKGKGRTGRGGA